MRNYQASTIPCCGSHHKITRVLLLYSHSRSKGLAIDHLTPPLCLLHNHSFRTRVLTLPLYLFQLTLFLHLTPTLLTVIPSLSFSPTFPSVQQCRM